MPRHHRVAIVFDQHAHALLANLADTCHVWLVASHENRDAAREYWSRAAPTADALASGVTVFVRTEVQPEDALASVLEVIEDHHGESAHDPPLDEVLIIGLDPNDAVLDVLRGLGFDDFTNVPLGLLATRRAPD